MGSLGGAEAQRLAARAGKAQARHQFAREMQFFVAVLRKVLFAQRLHRRPAQCDGDVGVVLRRRIGVGRLFAFVGCDCDADGFGFRFDDVCGVRIPEHRECAVEGVEVFGSANERCAPGPVDAVAFPDADAVQCIDERHDAVDRCNDARAAQHARERHGHFFGAGERGFSRGRRHVRVPA